MTPDQRRDLVERNHSRLSLARECELLGISRSSLYYRPVGWSSYNLELMRLIDEQYTRAPFYGVLRMTAWLQSREHPVNPKRVRRLMRVMSLEAIYPKPRLSRPHPEHRVYPYLLSGLSITRPDQVWATDITYIRMRQGFVYLVAIMDWFSRYVVSWRLSITLELEFCLEVLNEALKKTQPEIFNSDQGSQFTSPEFAGKLESRGVKVSMDGRGRFMDNIFVERLWRSVKYEEVYLKDYETVGEARSGLDCYFAFYNGERLHQALRYRTPESVYRDREVAR